MQQVPCNDTGTWRCNCQLPALEVFQANESIVLIHFGYIIKKRTARVYGCMGMGMRYKIKVKIIRVYLRSSMICRWGEGRNCRCRIYVVAGFVAMIWHRRGTAWWHDIGLIHCCAVGKRVSWSKETRGNAAASISRVEYHSGVELE